MKIITVCGSLKYKTEMMQITEEMTLHGNCMLSVIYPTSLVYTDKQKEVLGNMHKERIKISDAILVVNVNNYIGSSTRSEIEFAESLNKEIIYYTNLTPLNIKYERS